MSKATIWTTSLMALFVAGTAMAQDNRAHTPRPEADGPAVARLERRVEQLERSLERLERAVARLEANRSEGRGMMDGGGMMGGGMMGGGMMGRSRPNEQWRSQER
ncbi:MAG: hypothetical protein ACREQZ_07085 [Woeseiaceae bacterium]